ncbi:MAG: Tn3 family transposase, partial [Alphaproteobacteria bacterium]|nr:Tn3 family transposase [Alphaproteobacteria bacterium]
KEKAGTLRKPSTQIGFLLSCGYFKATKKFFKPKDFYQNDIAYVARILNFEPKKFTQEQYIQSTRQWHQDFILEFYGYRRFDGNALWVIEHEISSMMRSQLKPQLIFWRCIDILIRECVQIPPYFQISELILKAVNQRRKELTAVIRQELRPETKSLLDGLFAQETDSPYARYKLTLLKKLSQSTKPTQIKERSADLLYVAELHGDLKPLLPVLDLGYEGIQYFANSVIKSDIFQLNQRHEEDRYIHVVAFITYQYYRLQDNLVDTLLSAVKSYENGAKRYHKEWCYEQRKTQHQSLKTLTSSVDEKVFGFVHQIRDIIDNDGTDAGKLALIKNLLEANQTGFSDVEREWHDFKSGFDSGADDPRYYDILEERSLRLQNRVSPILKALNFQYETSAQPIADATQYFRKNSGAIRQNAPINFLEDAERKAVAGDGTFRPSLYKALLFMHVAGAIKSGQINLEYSYKYRSLDEYLIARNRWNTEKRDLLRRAELEAFKDCKPVLKKLKLALSKQYRDTNDHIQNNANPHFKAGTGNNFTIATPKQEDEAVDLLKPYFPDRHFVPLPEILSTVNAHTEFLQEFQHWQQRYAKGRTDDRVLYAGIVGLGCAIGIPKMSRISKLINDSALQHAVNWYFSLDNIRSANDCIVRFMDRMELPNIYRKNQGSLHTASDGQKFEVKTDSLNANYSFKYFGKGQGVTANTFIDERNLLWHSLVFSASERESAYVIDGLMHNDVIKSDIHSTDTHGYSEAIFAATHLLGVSYAPRIKNLKKQVLYVFKSEKYDQQPDWAIQPTKYINDAIIEECWDDVLRLVTTIKLKETSASDIFRRLNSYSKQHKLYQALKSFGQIIKTDFILHYLDDVELRQAIEKQLNKVELANRFTRAIAVGNPREFTQGDKEDQEIAESCNRLIKNAIICWNYLYLSQKLEGIDNPEQKEKLLDAISSHSPMSWEHTNLLGEYDFSDEKLKDTAGIRLPKMAA